MMKKAVLLLLVIVMMFRIIPFEAVQSYQLCYSDITAYINHHPIPSYACGGKTVICAEDLKHYGFDVNFDVQTMTLFVVRNTDVFVDGIEFKKFSYPNGFPAGTGCSSSVTVKIDGHVTESFAYNGTSMIAVEDLGFLGEVYWIPEQRAMKLWIDGVNIPEYKPVGYTEPQVKSPVPMIALTFDDGPGKYTDDILDVFEAYGAKATFFVVGDNVYDYPDALKRADLLGMEIGNHTYSHGILSDLSVADGAAQINRTDSAVLSVTGKKPGLLRPPGGRYNDAVCAYAGKPVVMWSVDTEDWKVRNASSVLNSIMTAENGDIVLMHDLYESTFEAVKLAVPKLIEKGYYLVTVSELAYYKGQSLSPGRVLKSIK